MGSINLQEFRWYIYTLFIILQKLIEDVKLTVVAAAYR